MEPSFYQIFRSAKPELAKRKVYVMDTGDTLQLVLPQTGERRSVPSRTYEKWSFYRTEIDVDVFTLPFKIRPSQAGLPPQLNSNFNAAVYLGRRLDFHQYRWQSITPTLGVRQLRSQGFGYGLFAGIGSATINDLVTSNRVGYEYEGVILDAGLAGIYDARVFNVGLAVGFDYLIDQNRQAWVYHNKPWIGVLFGLNLN
ncbi:hypothetical protein ACFSUS_27045 [Spirosoma soli]|uniref:DUF3575 domain-containing protein n=1 Tax=Spirosoma soli TaxID=1770529 RepID=A0ABW5MCV8_9BACT